MSIPVSTLWKDAIQSQFRYPAYLKATLLVTPPGLREKATVYSAESESLTPADSVMDGSSVATSPVATFEPDRWRGDGTMYLPDELPSKNHDMGWWSSEAATDSKPVVLSFQFDKPYTIPGIFAVWDSETSSWPTKVLLKGFDSTGSIRKEYLLESINSVSGYTDAPLDSVSRVDIEIYSWSVPSWRVRIAEIMFGVSLEFGNDQISKSSLKASADLLASELPTLGMQLTLYNYNQEVFDPLLQEGYSAYLAERQQVRVQWGFEVAPGNIQWMDPWPMYLSEWSIPSEGSTVTLKTTSRLEFLTNTYREGIFTAKPRSFREVAQRVLSSSGIIRESNSEIPWELPSVFSELYTTAPEPVEAANVIVQLLANASGCLLDINPSNNYIRIRSKCTQSGYTLGQLQQLGDPAFEVSDPLKSIQVGLHTFTPKSTKEQVYKFEGYLTRDMDLDISYNDDAIVYEPEIVVTGATLVDVVYYARSARVSLRVSSSLARVEISITGYIVKESTTFITTYSNKEISSGLEIVVDNPFITNLDTLKVVAAATESVYLKRQLADVSYLGYPELETGDTLAYQTKYGDFIGDITELSLTFNGGFTGEIYSRVVEYQTSLEFKTSNGESFILADGSTLLVSR